MKQVTTYVGIDAHKKDLFIAMLIGQEKTPVTVAAGERAAGRPAPRSQARARSTGPRQHLLRGRTVWLRVAAAGDDVACALRCDRARADSAEAR